MWLGSGAGWMSVSTSLTCCAALVGASSVACELGIDDNVVLLDLDFERLGDVGAGDALAARRGRLAEGVALLDGHVVALDARLTGTQERLAGGQVVLPAVPRAGQQRDLGLHAEVAGPAGDGPRRDPALAERPALVRAAVADPVE